MSDANLTKLTHFATDVPLPQLGPFMLRIHNDDGSNTTLPTLLGVNMIVPLNALLPHRRAHLEALKSRRPASWARFGIAMPETLNGPEAELDFMAAADLAVDPATASGAALAFMHPQLGSTSNKNAALILDLFINRAQSAGPLGDYIRQMDGTIAASQNYTDDDGTPLTLNAVLVAKSDGTVNDDTVLNQYAISSKLVGVAATPENPDGTPPDTEYLVSLLNEALISTTNEPTLQHSHWGVAQGHIDQRFDPGMTTAGVADAARLEAHQASKKAALLRTGSGAAMATTGALDETAGGYEFTINNKTPGNGLSIYSDTIAYDTDTNVFSIEVMNFYMRTMSTFVRFYDSDGNPVSAPPAQFLSGYPDLQEIMTEVKGLLNLDTDETFTNIVWALYAIFDIPVPIGNTTVELHWPDDAESADILFGSLGTSDWDTTADMIGVAATVLFQFISPIVFLVTGAYVTHSDWYKKLMEDKWLFAAVIIIAGLVASVVLAAVGELKWGIHKLVNFITNTLATKFVGALFGGLAWLAVKGLVKILEKGSTVLIEFFTIKITVDDLIDAIPFVGWATEIAGVVSTAGALIEAGTEALISPCTYTVNVTRSLEVTATVSPDPLHGSEGNPPIWPTEATYYKAVLQYKNGTTTTVSGALPTDPAARSQAIEVTFDKIPSGGEFQITFGVYSDTDWLAGNWTSAWTQAVLPAGAGSLDLTGAIIENLVPLTDQTQYLWSQTLGYTEANGHQWDNSAGAKPTETWHKLNSDGLEKVVSITSNNAAYMLGYAWQAADQNVPLKGAGSTPTNSPVFTFQNINTLSDPEASLKFSGVGFTGAAPLAYEQFGPEPLFSAPDSVKSDLDNGIIDQTLMDAFAAAQYPLPDDCTVQVLETSTYWTITLPDQTTAAYQLDRQSDGDINVYLYPTNPVGQNNFYLDTSVVPFQLRYVTLDDTTPFDMDQTTSYGAVSLPTVDSLVVHPADYVIAVCYNAHRMQIVPILETPVADEDVPEAGVVSGAGIREGLMLGPRAVSVTQDGRILVLESLNERVQAFDINGNPVACFHAGDVTTLAAADVAASLNAGLVPVALRDAFATAGVDLTQRWTLVASQTDTVQVVLADNGQYQLSYNNGPLSTVWTITDTDTDKTVYTAFLGADEITVSYAGGDDFTIPTAVADNLNYGYLGAKGVAAFYKAGQTVAPQAEVAGNGLYVDPADAMPDLCAGTIPDVITQALATAFITMPADTVVVCAISVLVQATDTSWVLNDADASKSYGVETDSTDPTLLDAILLSAIMNLHVDGTQQAKLTSFRHEDLARITAEDADSNQTYLDLATEMLGYMYVLGYTGDGSDADQYFVDIYDPLGVWLSRTPDTTINPDSTGIIAGGLAVDMWRNMFTLDYKSIAGPSGRVEPSVSMWVPTTPDGDWVRTRSTDGVGLGALIRADGVLFGGAAAGDFFCAVGPAKLWVHPARDEVIHRLKGIAWGGFANRKGECRVHLCGLFGMVARKQCVAGGEVTGVATGGLHRQFHAGAHQPLGDPCRCLPRFGRVLQMARDGHAARQVPSFYDQIKAQPP
eukprot:CAMPEP_0184411808 /NCGR_PEP_ID=MMETSP0738-20130409/5967_1 /TAXON_ID=385413 /ORGANISM="Thalassiosira miniscula, Strain CCMP1093" /LENGTH=1556 /DNA_ID=CAMNT_0026770137 /DNA_START=6 /DNA_END=4677 /DNA_ORIENTATION=+